jgi:asparagine synthase (glutamine-hydrolysing)
MTPGRDAAAHATSLMCGIWFSIGLPPDSARIDLVRHRGPDGSGSRVFESRVGPVMMGHRRLAIIDTSDAGLQPMSYAGDRYWLIFNGEIYNYLELRGELESRGHVFRTRSDSEVLLAAYAQWGEACLDRLVGMFAFVVMDTADQVAFLARDRFGIKPLYLAVSPSGLAAGSEIKQLVGLPGVPGRINLPRLYDFLAGGMSDHTAETMFAGVRQLRGGECLRLDLRQWHPGIEPPVRRWYELPQADTIDIAEDEAAERFLALFDDSIRLHLRSDVTVGSCLSGGLDSSAIVCVADRQVRAAGDAALFNSITACYAEKEFDERPFAEAVVAATRTAPHFIYPRAEDALTRAEQITWHQDEPYGSTSIFAQWCVFEEAAKIGVKVMLDGQGADEQLAGYHSAFGYHFASLIRRGRFLAVARGMIERRRFHGTDLVTQLRDALLPLVPRSMVAKLHRHHRTIAEHDWLGSPAFAELHGRYSPQNNALATNGFPPIDGIGELCRALTGVTNLPMLLHWEDRNSMAHGVESRVPFLDHRLVELTLGLGERHKIVGGDTKRVLRRAMSGIIPETIVQRRDKLGFATPEQSWFRGPLRSAIEAGVEDALGRYPDILNVTGTRALMRDMLDGTREVNFALWRIVSLGIWGRCFHLTV